MRGRRQSLLTKLGTAMALAACAENPSAPATAAASAAAGINSHSTKPSQLVAQASAGLRVRGEQDEMLRFESKVPGYGGFFRDSSGQVTVYLKRGVGTSNALVRSLLASQYSSRPEPAVREAMKTAASAQIIDGQYSLSELIAIENRIAYPEQTIPGFVGVGTSLRRNRVVVGFEDSGSLEAARELFDGMGIDPQALILETWGKFEVSSTFASKLRPTRGGIEISVINRTKVPWPYHSAIFAGGTLGWNVKTTWGETYFLTAGHVAGMLTATNGATNDTIVQPYPKTADGGATWTVDKVGYIVWNPPFTEGAFACDYAGIDFCTDADVAMGHYLSGVSGESRIATSTYEGLNGLIGTYNINGFYPVADVLPPEMVVGGPLGVHKSGYMTGTTTGELDLSLSTINVTICWGVGMPGYPCPGKAMRYTGITLVRGMTNVGGDSGAPVFAGNGSPYHALGLLVGRGGNHDNDGNCTNVDLCFTFFFKWSSLENKLGYGPLTPVG